MISVHVGSDTYGRVKAVSGVPIVTKFAMFQALPVFPLQSFYRTAADVVVDSGIPFIGSSQSTELVGIPLAALDKTSVLLAYVRAFFATLIVAGSVVLIPGTMHLMGEQLDDFAKNAAIALLGSLAIGICGGALTYIVPLTSRRERDIRQFCAELLGVAADPARVPVEIAQGWLARIEADLDALDHRRKRLIRDLIVTRAMSAQSSDAYSVETRTEELLDELRQLERSGGTT